MSDIEHLKKQAKLLVRWHRERNYAVAQRIRASLPRYRGLSDAAILARPFTLGEAQALVAREAGFDSWAALKSGPATMTNHAKPAKATPILTEAEPQLFVADVGKSCTFFQQTLGFDVVFTWGEPPFYGQVKRDNVRLNLRYVCEPVFGGDIRERESLLAASITVDDVKALFVAFKAAGAEFQQTLKRQPWGARDFVVRDPDGNLILFAGT
jgi:catechol 2,3-dioxygenase-like lactoylglutathione lyase family enzyme